MKTTAVILSCLTSFSLFADARSSQDTDDDIFQLFENSTLKSTQQEPSMQIAQADTQVLNQDASSEKTHTKNHYMVYGDFLYWQPFCNDLTWGNKNYGNTKTGYDNYTEQYRFNFDWDVGFRLGIKYKANWEDVSVDLNWTSFHTSTTLHKQSSQIKNSSIAALYPQLHLQGNPQSLSSPTIHSWKLSGSYRLTFDQFDLKMKKQCKLTSCFDMNPFIGIRGLIINHNFKSKEYVNSYGGIFKTSSPYDSSALTQRNNTNALGIFVGVNNKLQFGKGFSLFFDGDVFVGYGKNNSSFTAYQTVSGSKGGKDYIYEDSNSMKAMIDLAAGVNWKKSLFKDAIDLLIACGYEFHYIFQNPTFLYANPDNSGMSMSGSMQDMSKSFGFQGLTIRGGIGF